MILSSKEVGHYEQFYRQSHEGTKQSPTHCLCLDMSPSKEAVHITNCFWEEDNFPHRHNTEEFSLLLTFRNAL